MRLKSYQRTNKVLSHERILETRGLSYKNFLEIQRPYLHHTDT